MHFHNRATSDFQRMICCQQPLTGKPKPANPKIHIAGLVAAMTESELRVESERISYNPLG